MTQTNNYQLSQWAKTDRIQMEDFNSDNAKIEAALTVLAQAKGNCCIAAGSYVGTGTYGSANPNTLTFDFRPLVIWVNTTYTGSNSRHLVWLYPTQTVTSLTDLNNSYYITWGARSVSWYANVLNHQFNTEGTTYHYIALGVPA